MKSNFIKYMIFLTLATILFWTACKDGGNPVTSDFDPDSDIEQNVDSFVSEYVVGNLPGVAVLIARDSTVILEKCYGLANIQEQLPVSPGTPFYLASVSKQFTAMAIMILEERGWLTYEDKLETYFPQVPDSWNAITIHHLLTHQSGIPDYLNDLRIPTTGITNDQVLDILIQNEELEFSPGTKYEYSNSGYAILATLTGEVSNQPFHVFVKENIFDPLEMTKSLVYDESRPDIPDRAIGYSSQGVLFDYNLLTTGDGGIFSTIEDLHKWDQSLYTEKLISDETLERAYTSHVPEGYGYGWSVDVYKGLPHYSHGGGLVGYRTHISRFPSVKLTIVILSNGSYDWIYDLNDEIVRYYL